MARYSFVKEITLYIENGCSLKFNNVYDVQIEEDTFSALGNVSFTYENGRGEPQRAMFNSHKLVGMSMDLDGGVNG